MAHSKTYTNLAIVFMISAIVAVTAGGYYLHKQHQNALIEAKRLEEEQEKQRLEDEKRSKELDYLFENYVNRFKTELKDRATSFKENKTILVEMFNAYNFETPEYTKENYTMFNQDIAPALRASSDSIISLFENYSIKLAQELSSENSETQELFQEKWNKMKTRQLEKFVSFLSKQEKFLESYEELMTFYYVHSNLFSVDMDKNEFVFEREEDKKQHEKLLQNIKELK